LDVISKTLIYAFTFFSSGQLIQVMGMKKATVFVIVLLMMGSVIALGCIGGSGTSSSSSSTSPTSASSSATPATKTTATSSTTTTATTTTTAEHTQTERAYYPITIKDFANRTVTIEKEPRRVVTIAPSLTEDLYYLGLFDRVVGVTQFDDFPPGVANVTRIGGYGKYANLELIANLSPDLIIADSYSLSILDQLEKIAPVVIVDPKDINGIYRQIDLLGKVTNREEQAKLVIGEMKGEIAYIESKVRDLPRPKVFFILSYCQGYWTAGRGTFMDSVITLAGGRNIFNDTKGWVKVSDEQIIVRDPDVIVVLPTAGVNATELCNGPLSVTTAVKEGRVYTATDSNVYQRPSPRIVVAIEEMAEFLHPEAFGVSFNSTACAVSTS